MSKHPWTGNHIKLDGEWWRIDRVRTKDMDLSRSGLARIEPRSIMAGRKFYTSNQLHEMSLRKIFERDDAEYFARTGKHFESFHSWRFSGWPSDFRVCR